MAPAIPARSTSLQHSSLRRLAGEGSTASRLWSRGPGKHQEDSPVLGVKDTGAEHRQVLAGAHPQASPSNPFLNHNLMVMLLCKLPSAAPYFDWAPGNLPPLATQARPLGSPQSPSLLQVPSLNHIYCAKHFAHRILFQLPHSTQGCAGMCPSS